MMALAATAFLLGFIAGETTCFVALTRLAHRRAHARSGGDHLEGSARIDPCAPVPLPHREPSADTMAVLDLLVDSRS